MCGKVWLATKHPRSAVQPKHRQEEWNTVCFWFSLLSFIIFFNYKSGFFHQYTCDLKGQLTNSHWILEPNIIRLSERSLCTACSGCLNSEPKLNPFFSIPFATRGETSSRKFERPAWMLNMLMLVLLIG